MITPQNLISKLNNTIIELVVLKGRLEDYNAGPPLSLLTIEEIENELSLVMNDVPEMIDMIALTKPDPDILGSKLKECFLLPTEIIDILIELRKKAR